ncbi:MAG: hypothetical protein FWD14_01845 [Treponema sp.]|nr:hypothetical protein [Treponema sp.]
MVAQFNESNKVGKTAEAFAEQFFKKYNISYRNISDDKKHHDFLTDRFGKVEVKRNYHDAIWGKKGLYFWVELELDYKEFTGWWYKTKADYFLFFNEKGSAILIKNDTVFKDYVNHKIKYGEQTPYGENRIDFKKDQRYNRVIDVKNMRIYLDNLNDTGIDIKKYVKRERVN